MATPVLGNGKGNVGKHTVSECTPDHALHANNELQKIFEKPPKGENQKLLIGNRSRNWYLSKVQPFELYLQHGI